MELKLIYRKTTFLILFVCIPFFAKASWDLDVYNDTENVSIESYLSHQEFETQFKIDILIKLVQQLIEESEHPDLQVFMNINYYGTYQDSYYTLGYDKFEASKLSHSPEKREYEGLIIYIKDKDIKVKKILTILSNALNNIDYIKSNQTRVFKKSKYSPTNNPKFDTLYSISPEEINQYASNGNKLLDIIVAQKVDVERRFAEKEQKNINYYYQNNKYHFYNSEKTKKLLVVDNVLEIVGNTKDGYFIFDTDSTFYYLTMFNGKVKGKFKIDDLYQGREPIYNYKRKTKPTNLFLLNISNSATQILFVPDRNFVYSNYQEVDEKIIDILIQNKIEKQAKEKMKNDFTFNFEVAFYISLTTILILIFIIFQKKKLV